MIAKENKKIVPSTGYKSPYIVLAQARRSGIDIGVYADAVRAAENIEYPNRVKWFDVCDELLTDAHLYAVVQKRKSAVLSVPVEFRREGKPDDKINEQLRSPWFGRFLGDAWDHILFGSTLVQFYLDDGWINYDLVPRKHYDPVNRIILRRQGDMKGESFDSFPDLLFIGDGRSLGLMLAAAPYVIYKRNTMSDWAQFCEIFGMPLLEGIYDGADEEARMKLLNDLYNRGANTALVHPEGTNLTIHDSQTKSGSNDLYKGLAEFCNSEISKLFLGNTLTTEVGDHGTQALGTVHQSIEERIEEMDRQTILNLLNFEMTDIFASMGVNTTGGEFVFKVPQQTDLAARISIDERIKRLGIPVSDDYFYETYGIEKPANYEELKREQSQDVLLQNDTGRIENKRSSFRNRLSGFFAKAPQEGASEWD